MTQKAVVISRCCNNRTGIHLTAGVEYTYFAEGCWVDFFICCGSDGYTSSQAPWFARKLLTAIESRRRVPTAPWFALIGAIEGTDHTFVIGRKATLVAPATGQLICFANDLSAMYWNNWGRLILEVSPGDTAPNTAGTTAYAAHRSAVEIV